MAQARLWLWGFVPLAVLWLLAVTIETSPVETDVATRAKAALATSAWVPPEIAAHGRDVTLGGEAYDPDERAAVLASVDAAQGVRRVDDQSHLVPEVKPYVWSATKDGAKVTFEGSVPKPKVMTDLLATEIQDGAKVTDASQYARGAPAGFDAAAALALAQLGGLTQGKATITGTTLSISGVAKDGAARDAILAALAKLPAGFTLGDHGITAPTYDFTAIDDAASRTLTFEGAVPDDGARAALLQRAHDAFAGQTIVDHTKVQSGAPDGFADAVVTGLQQLARLDSGELKMSDTVISLSGSALYARAVDQIDGALKTLPSGFSAKSDLKALPAAAVVDAAGCQNLFADQLAKGTILFETASAKIDKASAGILDHLVAAALRCPSQSLEVSGHTDASGSDETNMDLSKRRAQAVVEYLVTAGLDPAHLTAVGYGKTRPIAPNDTPDGMAKNRRIEFLVK